MPKKGDGAKEAIFGLSVDIAEGRKAEEWPRFVAQLQAILNVLPAYTWYAAPSGALTFVNKRTADYLGVPQDHPLRFGIGTDARWDDWIPLLHPDDHEESRKYWSICLRTGEGGEHSYRVRSAQGDYRWFLTRFEPLRASDGTLLLWLGATMDIEEFKRAEEGLRESEYKLRQIFETVPAFLWSTDPAGEPTHMNQRLLDYSGMRFEGFKRLGWEVLVHPDDFPETARAFYQAIHAGTPNQWVTRLRRADGEFRWHQFRIEPLRDQQGRIVQWYGVTVDVDEGKKAEERPRFEAQLRTILNVLPALTWYAPPSGGLTFVSKRQGDFLGLPKDHPLRFGIDIGVPWDAHIPFLHPDDQEKGRKYWSNSLRTGEGYEHSYRVRDAQGNYRWLLTRTEPLRASDGTLQLWVGATLDIEELMRAEEGLRESEAKFRDYAETASDWFWEIGPDYKFTLLTENAFGSYAADRMGTGCWDHALDLETEPEKWRLIQATLDSRKPFRDFVYSSARRNGSPIYVKASGKPVFDAEGEFRGYRGTGTDVTALMRAQAERERLRQLESDLAHMNRLSVMGELTASLAHEITQPVAAARNNARAAMHFLDRNPPDLGEIREALASIVGDADRAGNIVDRIRDQIKKAPPRKHLFDLNEAINELILLAGSAVTENGVSVRTRLAEGLSPVEGDRVQLQQVVLNLILNAVEAMSTLQAGLREMSISTEQAQTGGVLVSVRDSGPGIDPDHLDTVFEAFYTTKSSGVGMGLSICRSIIDAHRGHLWADTNEPRGAVFQFILPTAEQEVTNSFPEAQQARERHEDTV
ncbi:PAS domain-containing protein [Mesorhizobium sp. M0622]|uniref:PAS domain-containing protein n=1 Tax=unclassified Mesorhizobium TaxID=325217 RepID=UPI003339304B